LDRIPENVRVNASYIMSNTQDTSIIGGLYSFAKEARIVLRIAVPRPSTPEREAQIEAIVNIYGDPLFFSRKEFGAPLGCYMAWVRGAIDWKGNFLPCPSMQLNEESEGLIPESFPLCHITELEEWLQNNRPRDLGYRCGFCNCGKENNDFIYRLFKGVEDVEFV
jgi:hypothetical protein